VKCETLQSIFDSRVSEVTGFNLTAKTVDTSVVDTFVSSKVETDYTNWEDFMEVVNSVKGETLQSKFDSRVSEVTGFDLTAKTVNTSAVDNYVATLISTDYTNWTEFMEVVNSVKGETLQSKFDSRVSEVTGFNLIAKTVVKTALENYKAELEALVASDYTNYDEIMTEITNALADDTIVLQSEFDAEVTRIKGIALEKAPVVKTALETYKAELQALVASDYTNYDEIMTEITNALADDTIILQSEFDAEVTRIKGIALEKAPVVKTALENYKAELEALVTSDYTNYDEIMTEITNTLADDTIVLQSEFDAEVTRIKAIILEKAQVNTNAVDNYVATLTRTDYTNWASFMVVVNSVKAETLQSVFDARVSEVTGFKLTAKTLNTNAVDNYVATLISTDYTNWEEFMEVVNSVKGETLQSKFDSRVSEVTRFNLTAKTVDTSVVDNYVASLVASNYTNWTEFMEVVNSVKGEILQSKFDNRVKEVLQFTLNAVPGYEITEVSVINSQPVVVKYGHTLGSANIQLRIKMSNGSTSTVTLTDNNCKVSNYNSTNIETAQTVTVEYQGKEVQFRVQVRDYATAINVTYNGNSNPNFCYGENLSADNIIIKPIFASTGEEGATLAHNVSGLTIGTVPSVATPTVVKDGKIEVPITYQNELTDGLLSTKLVINISAPKVKYTTNTGKSGYLDEVDTPFQEIVKIHSLDSYGIAGYVVVIDGNIRVGTNETWQSYDLSVDDKDHTIAVLYNGIEVYSKTITMKQPTVVKGTLEGGKTSCYAITFSDDEIEAIGEGGYITLESQLTYHLITITYEQLKENNTYTFKTEDKGSLYLITMTDSANTSRTLYTGVKIIPN
ncbi:MAG: hypothetical protein HFJ35_04775, partial [Clostridia bacterium]|nr:hypothetical protein [Clostridia bacterium]